MIPSRRSRPQRFPRGPIVAILALVAGCDGDRISSPTAPRTAAVVLESATVSVGGQVVNGMTLPRGHGQGASTRFEAKMIDAQGRPMAGQAASVRYQRPQGTGMMSPSGTMRLYDDGTHGDRVPGDGIYCYEDWPGDYGCHTASSPMGQYHYEFWGQGHGGLHTDHLTVVVTIH